MSKSILDKAEPRDYNLLNLGDNKMDIDLSLDIFLRIYGIASLCCIAFAFLNLLHGRRDRVALFFIAGMFLFLNFMSTLNAHQCGSLVNQFYYVSYDL
jgi:hypothetical protein